MADETNPETTETPAAPAADPAPAPAADASWTPTREQYEALAKKVNELDGYFQPEEPEPDYNDPNAYVDARFQQYEPAIQAAAKVAGEKRMNDIFAAVEKAEKIDFDHDLARNVAQAKLSSGEVQDAVKATEEGARYAAEVRKRERAAGIEEYQKSLQRPGTTDFEATGGERAPLNADTYDEVIARYSGQTEV